MKKTRSNPRAWSAEEIEILRFHWDTGQPIKTWVHLLNKRTVKATQCHGEKLGLPSRGNGKVSGDSPTWRLIQRALAGGVMLSPLDIAEKIGSTRATIYREMQQHYPQHVHIGGYGERPANGYWPKLWALGPGKDAPKPVSVPKAKREHDRWVRMKKEEPERIDIRYARERLRRAERNGKLIRRDPAASWIGGPPMP